MGNILKTKGGLVIDRPGRVLFVPVKADGTLDYVNAKRNVVPINTITITNSRTKTNIPDGNSFYPAGDRVTEIAGTIAIEFSTVDADIWAMSAGSELVTKETSSILRIEDYLKISEAGTIELEAKYKTDGYINVLGSDGTAFEKVTTDPQAGEYKVEVTGNKTTLTFATADKDKTVAVTFEAEAKTQSYSQGKKAMKYHKIIVATEYSTINDTEKVPVNLIVSQASLGGDMVDALQKDPSALKTLTYNMYAPLPGEEPYQVVFEDKATA